LNKDIKILVDEDIFINQEVLRRYLNKLGYKNINIVQNGAECIKTLNKTTYDIAFIDIKTPIKDGFDVVDFIKSNKIDIITVALTARVTSKEEYIKRGFDQVLFKPFELKQLSDLMKKINFL